MSLADLPLYLNDGRLDDMALLRLYVDENSQDAFAELVERHATWIRAVCRRSLRDREYADDATQLVFIILARKASQLSENTRVSGWLYRTTRFVLSDMRKRETRRKRRHTMAVRAAIERSGDGVFAYDPARQDGARETVAQILAMLPEHERKAVAMHFFDGLTFREIGESLGLSRDGAKKRVARALARLRNGNALKGFSAALIAAFAATLKAPAVAKAAVITARGQIAANFAKLTMLRAATATVLVASAMVYTVEETNISKRVVASREVSSSPQLASSSRIAVDSPAASSGVRAPVNMALPPQHVVLNNSSNVSLTHVSQSRRSLPTVAQANSGNASSGRTTSDMYVAPSTVDRRVNDRFSSAAAPVLASSSHASAGKQLEGKSDAPAEDQARAVEAVTRAPAAVEPAQVAHSAVTITPEIASQLKASAAADGSHAVRLSQAASAGNVVTASTANNGSAGQVKIATGDAKPSQQQITVGDSIEHALGLDTRHDNDEHTTTGHEAAEKANGNGGAKDKDLTSSQSNHDAKYGQGKVNGHHISTSDPGNAIADASGGESTGGYGLLELGETDQDQPDDSQHTGGSENSDKVDKHQDKPKHDKPKHELKNDEVTTDYAAPIALQMDQSDISAADTIMTLLSLDESVAKSDHKVARVTKKLDDDAVETLTGVLAMRYSSDGDFRITRQ